MPVMEKIRQGTDSTAMRLVFGAIVLVFVFWGIGSGMGQQAQIIAEVDGERITDTQMQRILRMRARGASNMDEDELEALKREVMTGIIEQRALVHEAERLGLEVSGEEVAWNVFSTEGFQDTEGVFSQELYERALKRTGYTMGVYEEQLREGLLLTKLQNVLAASVHVTDAEVKRYFERDSARLSVRWVLIPDSALLADVPVEDAAVDAFLATSMAEIEAAYNGELKARYHRPAKATLSSILLRSDLNSGQASDEDLTKRMQTIAAAAGEGVDFGELARTWSEDLSAVNGGAMGTLSEPQLDPDVAKAVFATSAGSVTEIVRTGRGLQLFFVHAIEPATDTPLEDAKAEIARELLARQGVDIFAAEFSEKVRAAWTDPAVAPADLLRSYALFDRSAPSVAPANPSLPGVPPSIALEAALRSSRAAGVLPSTYPVEGGRVVAAVEHYEPPDMDLFEEERDRLHEILRLQKQSAFVATWREELLNRTKVVKYYNP